MVKDFCCNCFQFSFFPRRIWRASEKTTIIADGWQIHRSVFYTCHCSSLFKPIFNCAFSNNFHRAFPFIPLFNCVFQRITSFHTTNYFHFHQPYRTIILYWSWQMILSSQISRNVDYHHFFTWPSYYKILTDNINSIRKIHWYLIRLEIVINIWIIKY